MKELIKLVFEQPIRRLRRENLLDFFLPRCENTQFWLIAICSYKQKSNGLRYCMLNSLRNISHVS